MRIALISDIHGNRPALEAVLADIRQAGVDQIICLGDIANVGPHPGDCLDIIRDLRCVTLQGNHELYLLGRGVDEDWQTCPTWSPVRWTRRQLRPDHFDYMNGLPLAYELPTGDQAGATFVHGSPLDQFHGFMGHHSDAEVAERMNGLDHVTLFSGHTHRPLYRRWSNSWLVNVGSVGMPLDGDSLAKYVIATRQKQSWRVEFRRIEYNTKQLMVDFDRLGLQAEGGVITALFRYQILTGSPIAYHYIYSLRQRAAALAIPVAEAYRHQPIPPELQQWCA
jgi:predicted phosphodiesterase